MLNFFPNLSTSQPPGSFLRQGARLVFGARRGPHGGVLLRQSGRGLPVHRQGTALFPTFSFLYICKKLFFKIDLKLKFLGQFADLKFPIFQNCSIFCNKYSAFLKGPWILLLLFSDEVLPLTGVYVLVRPTFVKHLIGEATKFMAGTVIRAPL